MGSPDSYGLEAAARVLTLTTSTKIVFLTQEKDVDVVTEAFRIGGRAYVSKQDAEAELQTALNAVLQGRRFVSSGLPRDGIELNKPLD